MFLFSQQFYGDISDLKTPTEKEEALHNLEVNGVEIDKEHIHLNNKVVKIDQIYQETKKNAPIPPDHCKIIVRRLKKVQLIPTEK